MPIHSAIPTGSGAIVVHQMLARHIANYRVQAYNPWLTLYPPLLNRYRNKLARIVHTTPDHAIFVCHPQQQLVVTFHNYLLDDFMQNYSSLLQKIHYRTDLRYFTHRALSRALRVTAVSQFTANLVKQDLGYSGEITVIPNAVDTVLFCPQRMVQHKNKIRVLFGGNLTRRKGLYLLDEIASQLGPDFTILCLGKNTKAFSAPNIQVIDKIPHDKMPDLYHSVAMLLLPTIREGMSLAVLEAMSCGLPIITTDCSSMPELVHSGLGGYLCQLNDAKEMVNKIKYLSAEPQSRQQMGDYNRSVIEQHHSLATMLNAYAELFDSIG